MRRSSVIILSCLRCVIAEAIIVEIDLGRPLLQDRHNVIEGAETVFVRWASGVGPVDWHDRIVSVKSQYLSYS